MASKKTSEAAGVLLSKEPVALDELRRTRALSYRDAKEKEAFEDNLEDLAQAYRSSRSPEWRPILGLRYGVALWILNRHEEAIEVLDAVKGDNGDARYFLGLCYLAVGDGGKASKALKTAVNKCGDPVGAAMLLVEAWRRKGEPEKGWEIVREHEDEHKNVADLHYVKAGLLEDEGDYETAIDELERAVELDPDNGKALFRLGYLNDLRGEDARAMELYRRCAELRPPFANALINLGVLYEDAGHFEEAARCYRRVLKADPTNQRARLFLKDAMGSKTMYYDEEVEKRIDRTSKILRTPVTDFELSVRSRNCLEKMNIRSLGDLVQTTEDDLLNFKNFGETSLGEIKRILIGKGLRLGMNVVHTAKGPALTEPESVLPPEQEEALLEPIEHLELSIRSRKCVDSLTIRTVGDLIQKSPTELLACQNFGQTSLKEVQEKLAELGLKLSEDE